MLVGILCKTNKPSFCLILKVSHALVVCLVYYLDCICLSLYINALPEWAIPKKVQTQTEGSWEYTFVKFRSPHHPLPPLLPGIFRFVTLPVEIPEKTIFHLCKFYKIVWHPSEIPKSKTKTHGNPTWHEFAWVFLEHPWKFHYFFNWILEFFSSVSLEISCLPPRYSLDFSGIAHPIKHITEWT